MKRMHVGLKVDDLDASVAFYTQLFGVEPTIRKPDYAKWMLDDPLVNFSLDCHGDCVGGGFHLGIQAGSEAALSEMRETLDSGGLERQDQNELTCGYQTQNKSWVFDPQGVAWEIFHTYDRSEFYGTSEMPGSA